jgi:exopolysaccharide biosynthesis polyprenyl glycosylphosphotransferase
MSDTSSGRSYWVPPELLETRTEQAVGPVTRFAATHVGERRGLGAVTRTREREAARTATKRRVLIVGAGARGQDIAQELAADARSSYHVVGFADDDAGLPCIGDLPILGSFADVLELTDRYAIDDVIIAYMPSWQEELIKRAMQQGASRLQIKVLPGFYDAMLGDCRIERIMDIPLVRITGNGPGRVFLFAKRCFDVLFSVIGLIATVPVLLLAAAAIKLTSRGPFLFCQERVGRHGRVFRIYKLRTMVLNAERLTGPVLAQEYDERITAVGRLLRTTRLDEIPQFWNVLRGDMSVVGPRPERPEFADEFAAHIPGYRQRLKVRPGITGLAQVYGDYLTSVYHKLRYDWIYINRMSFWQEVRILLRTVGVVFGRSGT